MTIFFYTSGINKHLLVAADVHSASLSFSLFGLSAEADSSQKVEEVRDKPVVTMAPAARNFHNLSDPLKLFDCTWIAGTIVDEKF